MRTSDSNAGPDIPPAVGMNEEQRQTLRLRWLLARRLARASRYAEARSFYPPGWRAAFDRYVRALRSAESAPRSSESRAWALWTAALEARHHGIELLGTEAAPDWFAYGGDFEADDPAQFRLGHTALHRDRYDEKSEIISLPRVLRATATEARRLEASRSTPEKRFHYRYQAAALAWRAALLLPGDDPRTASMLNIAGRWLAPRDPMAADRFYQAIESRCQGAELGQLATARRWFVWGIEPQVPDRPEPVDESASELHWLP